ncbi:hypothetical protein [Butyricicoccus faecihominis]|uniref:hypothetical protein n=1 Tax=Butyricicoccus faecihominis TaxID=1712515 RepID=UPI002479B1A5|nr:hypothetical protein [Butyricicoccus faecihominis]
MPEPEDRCLASLLGRRKPLTRKLGRDYALSMALYATGNYDAAYLAGLIADSKAMREADFEKWIL